MKTQSSTDITPPHRKQMNIEKQNTYHFIFFFYSTNILPFKLLNFDISKTIFTKNSLHEDFLFTNFFNRFFKMNVGPE